MIYMVSLTALVILVVSLLRKRLYRHEFKEIQASIARIEADISWIREHI